MQIGWKMQMTENKKLNSILFLMYSASSECFKFSVEQKQLKRNKQTKTLSLEVYILLSTEPLRENLKSDSNKNI